MNATLPIPDDAALLRQRWPHEWRDAARCGFLHRFDGEREEGGYPRGFHLWRVDRRNAWFSGFNVGFHDRLRLVHVEAR